MEETDTERSLIRCDKELRELKGIHHEKAWLITMAMIDWELERDLISGKRSETTAPFNTLASPYHAAPRVATPSPAAPYPAWH
jgi:hypothetical protein